MGLRKRSHTKDASDVKTSWVMLAEGGGYTPLPGETTLYQSPPRTTLALQSTAQSRTQSNTGAAEPYSLQCKSGVVYLTNRRVIYLPVSPTPTLQSFAVPILNVTDSRVTAPWFGANKWEAAILPVVGGGIPVQTHNTGLDLVMEFKEGGAFDFATTFERLRERLKHAVDIAHTAGDGVESNGRGGGPLAGVDLANVHLEDLPAYEERGAPARREDGPLGRDSIGTLGSGSEATGSTSTVGSPRREQAERYAVPPDEPPPGYEEVQRDSVADELERRLRGGV